MPRQRPIAPARERARIGNSKPLCKSDLMGYVSLRGHFAPSPAPNIYTILSQWLLPTTRGTCIHRKRLNTLRSPSLWFENVAPRWCSSWDGVGRRHRNKMTSQEQPSCRVRHHCTSDPEIENKQWLGVINGASLGRGE
jgi:hypothetical protein